MQALANPLESGYDEQPDRKYTDAIEGDETGYESAERRFSGKAHPFSAIMAVFAQPVPAYVMEIEECCEVTGLRKPLLRILI